MKLEKAHLLFSELMQEWACSEGDLMHLIWTERIRPAVYLDGRFNPVYWVEHDEFGLSAVAYYCTTTPFCNGFYYLQGLLPDGGKKFHFALFSKERDPRKDVHEYGSMAKIDEGIDQGFSDWGNYDEWYGIPDPGFNHLYVKENAIFMREEIARFEREHMQPVDGTDEPGNQVAALRGAQPQTDELSKSEKKIRVIVAAAEAQGYEALSIPTGGKTLLRKKCIESRPDLFGSGHDPFNGAWKSASNSTPPRLRMAGHDMYSGK